MKYLIYRTFRTEEGKVGPFEKRKEGLKMDVTMWPARSPERTWLESNENNNERWDFSIQFGSLSEGDEITLGSMKYEDLQKLKQLISAAIRD